ncbi:MAG: DUF4365 domain-containing protein [Candidatus Aquicultor sp.]
MKKQKGSRTRWEALPQRPKEHVHSDLGVRKFYELFTDPWFIAREESRSDYGVDIVIEALTDGGKHPTNIRSHAQVKSSTKKPNADGSYSYSVPFSNLNYLLNNPNSLYVFYSVRDDKLLYCTAESAYNTYNGTKNITIRFAEVLDQRAVKNIHSQIMATSLSIRDLLLSPNRRMIINPDQFVYSTDEEGKVIFLHNLIWENAFGKIPDGYEIYHINGNAFDNRRANLALRKTVNPFPIEEFQIDVSNAQITNVLSVLLEGDKAILIDDVPPPPKKAFVNIVNSLLSQGWSISEEQLSALQLKMKMLLEMDL